MVGHVVHTRECCDHPHAGLCVSKTLWAGSQAYYRLHALGGSVASHPSMKTGGPKGSLVLFTSDSPVPCPAPSCSSSPPNSASAGPLQMSWRPQYRSSKFRNVYGKVANRENCFDGIPITKNVHDNHFCAVNARFLAIVTESAGGGSFLVIPLEQVSGALVALRF